MEKPRKIHFIGIGGITHCDLAICLRKSGNQITVSDEAISDDLKAKLLSHNILPEKLGWNPEHIQNSIDVVIASSSITIENPELRRAQQLNLSISSFPDFIYQQSVDKQRLVIAGSTGKNIIALLIIHTLTFHKRRFDYAVSTIPAGKESTVSLSSAPLIVIEGQEVITSPLDASLEFLKYRHHIGVISDIEWTQSKNTPSKDQYISQFGRFETSLPKSGVLLYNEKDSLITGLLKLNTPDVLYIPYAAHPSLRENGQEYLITDKEHYPLKINGPNALLNMNAAKDTLKKLGISSGMFYQAIRSFQVAGR